ncbi:3-carboxy-cis,cis-muconate cycloisomerase, partial [Blastococcus deserti]
TVAAARDPELAAGLADALTPAVGRGAAHDAAAEAVREAARGGRSLREVIRARGDVDVDALLAAVPDTGEAAAQVDAALADHRRLIEGTP